MVGRRAIRSEERRTGPIAHWYAAMTMTTGWCMTMGGHAIETIGIDPPRGYRGTIPGCSGSAPTSLSRVVQIDARQSFLCQASLVIAHGAFCCLWHCALRQCRQTLTARLVQYQNDPHGPLCRGAALWQTRDFPNGWVATRQEDAAERSVSGASEQAGHTTVTPSLCCGYARKGCTDAVVPQVKAC